MPEYQITYELIDDHERTSTKTFNTVPTLADDAEASLAAADLASDLANLTKMRILAYTVKSRTVYTDTVDSGANKDAGVTFTMRKADNYKAPIRVPSPIEGIFLPSSEVVDNTATAVAAFVEHFITGDFTFSDGEQATELVKGILDK